VFDLVFVAKLRRTIGGRGVKSARGNGTEFVYSNW